MINDFVFVSLAKSCPRLERPANSRIAVTRYTVGGSATYTCDEHFTMQGKNRRICMSTGTWSGTEPTCTSKRLFNKSLFGMLTLLISFPGNSNCPPLTATENMEIIYSSDNGELSTNLREYPIGSFAQLECLDGTQLTTEMSELICNEDGEWDGEMGHCEVVSEKTTHPLEMSPSTFYNSTYPATTTPTIYSPSTEYTKHLYSEIPEGFWSELRNYLFHGCQTTTYQSVLCRVTSRHRFSDLSYNPPRTVAGEADVLNVLRRVSSDPSVDLLTIDSFNDKVIAGNSIPEDSLRQFLSFSIDPIVWNYKSIHDLDSEIVKLLFKIVSPVFKNFQLKYDFEDLFSSVPTSASAEITTEVTTQKSCLLSLLPQLANGIHELVDGQVQYRCLETFKMVGNYEVTCGTNGNWELVGSGSCQRKCGLLQMPVVMKPQSKILEITLEGGALMNF